MAWEEVYYLVVHKISVTSPTALELQYQAFDTPVPKRWYSSGTGISLKNFSAFTFAASMFGIFTDKL